MKGGGKKTSSIFPFSTSWSQKTGFQPRKKKCIKLSFINIVLRTENLFGCFWTLTKSFLSRNWQFQLTTFNWQLSINQVIRAIEQFDKSINSRNRWKWLTNRDNHCERTKGDTGEITFWTSFSNNFVAFSYFRPKFDWVCRKTQGLTKNWIIIEQIGWDRLDISTVLVKFFFLNKKITCCGRVKST